MRRLCSAALLVLLTGCATKTTDQRRIAQVTVFAEPGAPIASTTEDEERLTTHCFQGCPILDPEYEHGPTTVVARDGYVLAHSDADKIPLWVAEFVPVDQLGGNALRRNKFFPEPLLKAGKRAELADYKGSGYDRGHQAPAGNQTTDQRLKDETFSLANMAPQKGALNQRLWANLEDQTRDWAQQAGSAYMITGAFFYDPEEEDPNTADGIINYQTIGNGSVAVPTHFYKIVITTTPLRAIGFVAENRSYTNQQDFASLIKPIDWIEEKTGINFMPGLEDETIEATASPLW